MENAAWIKVKMGDVCESISNTYTLNSSKVVLLNTSDILDGKVLNHKKIPNKNLKGQFKKTFKLNDILYSEIRPKNKRFAFIDFVPEIYIASTKLMVLRSKENKIIPEFLFLILKSNSMLNNLQILAEGRSGTFPQITFNQLSNVEISLPPLKLQKKISYILNILDNKIEINKKINKNLELMVQNLFNQYFINFNFANENYKINTERIETKLGNIPSNWNVKSIDSVCDVAIGKTPPRKEKEWFSLETFDIKWVSIKDLGNSGAYIFETSEYLTKKAIEKFNIKLIRENTLLLSFKLTIGRLAITTDVMTTNEAIAHFNIKDEKILPLEYLYLYLKNFNYASLGSTSSIAKAINSKIVKKIPVIVPDHIILKIFKEKSSKIFQLLKNNQLEIIKLEKIRDILLPKLMSGEIDVSDVEI